MQQHLLNQHISDKMGNGEAPSVLTLKAANGLEIPYVGYAIMDFEMEGVKIPSCGVVIVKDKCLTSPLILGMNVITACWDTLFQSRERPVSLSCQNPKARKAWSQAFAVCQRTIATSEGDRLLGYVWPASRQGIRVPARSEMVVWGRARMGPRGSDYCGLVEALPDPDALEQGFCCQ